MTSDIAGYDDWPAVVRARPVVSGDALTTAVGRALGVPSPEPGPVEVGERSTGDGVERTELSWDTGFGPRTRAWYLRPEGAGDAVLPGVLALHCHANVKAVGAERLVGTSRPVAADLQRELYGGRPLAEGLARAGFAVLAHDTFGWGSRRFALDPLPRRVDRWLRQEDRELADPDRRYDAAASLHEGTAAKYAGVLGTSMAGMAAHDDLVALHHLRALPGVDAERVAVTGFSGGGGRSAVLTALDPTIRASAIVCMMSTFAALLPEHLDAHSWYLAVPGLPAVLDWPEVALGRGAHDQLVVYAEDDELFPRDGMAAADRLLRERFAAGRYESAWYPGPHRFDTDMQDRVTGFLTASLAR
ncbi:acetylesterase [Georgenia phoenicis]|uniref:dienelactone hydrolase family protein n=1 Tax=unclassified Georgenia TaxID=2626815 RepID=UPI0039AF065A